MRRLRICTLLGTFAVTLICTSVAPQLARAQQPLRGDVNSDRRVDIGDPIFLLTYIFSGGTAPSCKPTANANGDGRLDISDAITILTYLFSAPTTLPPLTPEEVAQCNQPPPPVTVVRHGAFQEVLDPGHGVGGNVEQLSDGTIRIRSFFYDGTGTPQVVILLAKETGFENAGFTISPDLVRNREYVDETLVYPIPPEATNDKFQVVALWCNSFPLTYAIAKLFNNVP